MRRAPESRKYDELSRYLSRESRERVTLSFASIERVIGSELPSSARSSASFWGNDLTHSHARAWIDEGWLTSGVSMSGQTVTFVRNAKAEQKRRESAVLDVAALACGSRAKGRAVLREARERTARAGAMRDVRLLYQMTWSLLLSDVDVEYDFAPPPARGSRTRRDAGWVSAPRQLGSQTVRMTFVEGRTDVVVTHGEDLADPSLWPADRVDQAFLFIAYWESHSPWLVSHRALATELNAPRELRASLSFPRWPTRQECRRVFRWVNHEADAFEDGLRKILYRTTPIDAERAISICLKRLARHVRPPAELVTSHGRSDVDLLFPLLEVFSDHDDGMPRSNEPEEGVSGPGVTNR